MSPVIRIDEEVKAELEKRSVKYGLVFGSPNDVLRVEFGLTKHPSDQALATETRRGQESEFEPSSRQLEEQMTDLTAQLIQRIVRDIQARTGDTIEARPRRSDRRHGLYRSRSPRFFAEVHPYTLRKNRARIEVPEHLVTRPDESLPLYDWRWERGWWGKPSLLIDIPYDGSDWNAAKYRQAIDILVQAWQG